MSTEKDGTPESLAGATRPPDPNDDDGDVTNVKEVALPRLNEDVTGEGDPTTVKKIDIPRMPGLTLKLPPEESGPQALGTPDEPTTAAPTTVQVDPAAMAAEEDVDAEETADAADVEEVTDVEVLEEELASEPAAEKSLLEQAIADARNVLADEGYQRLVALYEREIEAIVKSPTPDKARVALYQHEIGELTETRAGDEGAAVKAYAKALSSDATLKPNLWAIRRVFERRALWPNLQKLLDAELRFAKTPDERAELLVEKGQLLEDRLNDPPGALDCYLKAVEADPQALAAWMALEKIYTRERDLAGVARVLRGMAEATHEPARKVTLLIDLARLQESVDGGSPEEAQGLLRQALTVGADAERVLDELERLAERSGRSDELLIVLDERAQRLTAQAGELPAEQRLAVNDKLVALRRRQAQLCRERNEGDKAWAYLQQALAITPGEPLLVRELAELAASLSRWEELADLLAARVESAPPARKVALRLERAEALRRAGKVSEADAAEAEVARDEPGHLGLLVARERAALGAGDWDRLAALYLAEAELANSDGTPTGKPDPRWAAEALVAAAAALGDHLGKDPEAHKALGDALALVPHFPPAVDALERLYVRTGKHAELAALVESELSASPPPGRAELLVDTLIAAREAMEDVAGAAVAARRAVELRPDDVRARVRLYELDRAAQRWADAAEDLEKLAPMVSEERRIEVILERGDLLEHKLDDAVGAAKAYREALALKPGDARAGDAFESLSRKRVRDSGPHEQPQQAWDELAAALKREAQASLSEEQIALALLKLAEIHERERKNPADAAQAYRDLLDRVPGHAAALRGLGRAHAALGDEPQRAQALEQEVDALAPGARGDALFRLGELYEDSLKQPDRADDAYSRALEAGPSAHPAIGRLRMAVRAREPGAIAQALERLEPFIGGNGAGANARAALLGERAELLRQAGDLDDAVKLLDEALAIDPEARAGRRLRTRLAAVSGDATALGDALEALAERTSDPALQAAFERRAAMLALGSGSRATRIEAAAQQRVRQAHARAPSDVATLVALCDTVADPDALLARARLAEGAAATDTLIDWLVEAGEALEGVGRLGEAALQVQRALELDPRHVPALELARRLAQAGGDDKAYAAASARLGAEILESERAAQIYRQAAQAFERAGAEREAAAAWRAVLDRTPLDGDAFNHARDLLRAIHTQDKKAGPLVELYTHRLEHVRGDADRLTLHLQRAQLCADEGDREGAERDLRAALAIDPVSPEALRRLAELLGGSDAGRDEAIQIWGRYLEDENDRERRRFALLRLSNLEESGGHVEEAVRYLEEAIRLAASAADARPEHEHLAALLVRQRQWQRAVDALRQLSELLPDGRERAGVEIRVATIYREGFSDPRAAVEALLRALRSDPLSMEALGKLMPLADAGHVLPLELEEKLESAIDKARQQVLESPLSVEPYQALTRLWGWRGDDDARLMSAQAEALAGHRAAPTREHAVEPSRELTAATWDRLFPETARSVALEVWRAAGESVVELFGPTLESIGVGKKERVNAKGTPVAWIPVDKIVRALCGGSFGYELYASPRADVCEIVGHALVCGPNFATPLGSALRFRLARRAALMRDRLGPVELLDDDELGLFFAACARVAELPRPPALAGFPDARVEERARALGKVIARKDKKAIAAIGARVATLPPPGEWRQAILEGVARAGLVVCGDLPATLAELNLTLGKDRLAQSLTVFATSEDLRVARREMGLKG